MAHKIMSCSLSISLDKSQTPYQERFRCNGIQQFVYAANTVLKMAKEIDISWVVGNYLVIDQQTVCLTPENLDIES